MRGGRPQQNDQSSKGPSASSGTPQRVWIAQALSQVTTAFKTARWWACVRHQVQKANTSYTTFFPKNRLLFFNFSILFSIFCNFQKKISIFFNSLKTVSQFFWNHTRAYAWLGGRLQIISYATNFFLQSWCKLLLALFVAVTQNLPKTKWLSFSSIFSIDFKKLWIFQKQSMRKLSLVSSHRMHG